MLPSRIHYFGLTVFVAAWLASNHFRPWVNFHSELLALAAVCLLVGGQLLSIRQPLVFPRIFTWTALAILIPWLHFAFGISFFAGDALVSSIFGVGLMAALFVGYSFAAHDRSTALLGFMHALWIAAFASAAVGILQWLELEQVLGIYGVSGGGGRALGNLGQPNQLATLLLIGMSALAYVHDRKVIGHVPLFLGIALLSFAFVLAQSRTGYLSGVALGTFLIWKRASVQLRVPIIAIASWMLVLSLAVSFFPYINSALMFEEARSAGDQASISERFLLWEQMLYAISQAPWLGYGWNQSAVAQTVAAVAVPGSTPFTYAHNFALDMVVWSGLPAGIFVTLLCGYWFATRLFRASRPDAIFAMACLIPFAVHSMLEYPFAYSYFLVTAGVAAGVVEASAGGKRGLDLNRHFLGGVLALYVMIGSYFSYEYLLVEEDFRIARFEMQRVGSTPDEYQIPDIWLSTHLAALLKATRQPIEPNMNLKEISNLREVAQRFPYGPSTFRYAVALGLNGDADGASHQMALVRGLYGDSYYKVTKRRFLVLQQEQYPELEGVMLE